MRTPRGFVLPAMLVVLVLLGAVLGGAFFFALEEERIGRNELASDRAMAAADAGAAEVAAGWRATREGAVPPGDSLVIVPALDPRIGTATVTLRGLGESVVLLKARGVDPTGIASRETDVLVRLLPPPAATPAALVSNTAVTPDVAAAVDGTDHVPAGWRCPAGTARPAVAASWTGSWSDWDSLAAKAEVGTALPDAAHPAILVQGDLNLMGGSGTGVLLVSGDMVVDGGAMLTGLLLVRGTLEFRGAGGQVVGAARVGAVQAAASAENGLPLILWSGCAVGRSLRPLAGIGRIKGWWWGDPSGGW